MTDQEQRRVSIRAFADANGLKIAPWAEASGIRESTVRDFLKRRNQTMTDATYEKLAAGATQLLRRRVLAAEIRGETTLQQTLAVAGYIGAGGAVVYDDAYAKGAGLDDVEAPPGESKSVVAVAIRGTSQLPLYRDGEIVYYTREPPYSPIDLVNEPCVVRIAEPDGRVLLKTIKMGSKPRRFTLTSLNDDDIPNVRLEWAAPVLWVKRNPPPWRSAPAEPTRKVRKT